MSPSHILPANLLEKYDVEFVTFGDKVSDAKVVTDLVVEQPAWADGLTLLEGTRVAITPPADAEGAAVKLDDATPFTLMKMADMCLTQRANHG